MHGSLVLRLKCESSQSRSEPYKQWKFSAGTSVAPSKGWNEATTLVGDSRHKFAIKIVSPAGPLKRQKYLYYCTSCGWTFVVRYHLLLKTRIEAVDWTARALPDRQSSKRVATFGNGPCPGPATIASDERHTLRVVTTKSRSLARRRWRILSPSAG